jgi:hypothetical protein
MKTQFIVEYLQSHDFEFERKIGENEVWRNKKQILVIHPITGVKLIYRLDMFNEHYDESVIDSDVARLDYQTKIKQMKTSSL